MRIVLIAALDAGGVIGSPDGGIPWDLPRDRAHFRARTAGRALLLGRRTFEEMSGWFEDRRPIVLTRRHFYPHPEAAATANSVNGAISIARDDWTESELLVCGGASVYAAAIEYAHELILTHVQGTFPGCARFPTITPSVWTKASSELHPTDPENPWPIEFARYLRSSGVSP